MGGTQGEGGPGAVPTLATTLGRRVGTSSLASSSRDPGPGAVPTLATTLGRTVGTSSLAASSRLSSPTGV